MRIDELRTTLDQDTSDALAGSAHESADRLGAVHARVARVRRRRRATALGATVAAAVAAVATLVVPPLVHDAAPQPADTRTPSTLAGWKIPDHRTVEGFDYAYVRGIETDRAKLSVVLPAGDKQRTLTWASSSKDARAFVSLTVDGQEVSRSTAGGLESGQVLYPGDKHTVVLRVTGASHGTRLGLAVYDRTARMPAGVTNGVSTFRRQVAEDHLVGARIGDPGQQRIDLDLVVPSTRLRFSSFCTGAREGTAVATTRINGHEVSGDPCDGEAEQDPGSGGSWFADGTLAGWGVRPGSTVHLTMLLTKHMGGTALADAPRAAMGVAVYEVAPPVATVAGWDVPRLTESHGSSWTYTTSAQSLPGERTLRLHLPAATRDREVSVASNSLVNGLVRLYVDGEARDDTEDYTGSTGGSFGVAVTLVAGGPHTVELRIAHGGGPRAVLGLVVTTRAR